jgi:predicted MFS family arabinose efflux permease
MCSLSEEENDMFSKFVMVLLDLGVIIGAAIGGFLVFSGLFAESAPQTAAAAALGVGFAVVPYVISSIAHRQLERIRWDKLGNN